MRVNPAKHYSRIHTTMRTHYDWFVGSTHYLLSEYKSFLEIGRSRSGSGSKSKPIGCSVPLHYTLNQNWLFCAKTHKIQFVITRFEPMKFGTFWTNFWDLLLCVLKGFWKLPLCWFYSTFFDQVSTIFILWYILSDINSFSNFKNRFLVWLWI